jgi:predicted Zn-dependent protease
MKRLISLVLIIALMYSSQVWAVADFKRGTILRDAEIERTLKSYIEPIFKAAGLDPQNLHFYLIYDPELNAFATTRYTIVLHSGLVQKAKNVDEVIGVLAHETGHIAGGHIARTEAVMKKSAMIGMAAAALGVLAGIATGRGDLSSAMIMGGMDTTYKNMFHYSRGQEAAADQAAVRFLNSLHWPAQGLLSFMEVLSQQELLTAEQQDLYSRTHPMSADRVTFLKNSIKPESASYAFPGGYHKSFQIIKAKMDGYLNPPGQTLLKYSERDPSFEARYARAIAFYRNNQTEKSLALLTQLCQEDPHNPYLFELKGQILYENGKIAQAAEALERAHNNAPHEALIMIMLAQCLLELHNSGSTQANTLNKALNLLQQSLKAEQENPMPWHLMAMVYGRQNNIGMAALSLAEEALCVNKFKIAKDQAKRALMHIQSQQARLRANDIIRLADDELKEGDGRE